MRLLEGSDLHPLQPCCCTHGQHHYIREYQAVGAVQRTTLGVSRLLSLFISTSMPLLRATAMQFFWSPISMPATLILAVAAAH